MGISDRSSLKYRAKDALRQAAYDPKKLVLIHTAAMSVLTLIAAVLSFLLQDGISGTGGLSGIGLRTVLTTASDLLQTLVNLVLPFWSFGYLIAMLKIIRREQVGPGTLLEGFRYFFPLLRLLLIKALLYVGIALLCLYPSSVIFSLTPFSAELGALLEPVMTMTSETDIALYLNDATVAAVGNAMLPMLFIYMAMYLLICIPVSYRLRFADYALVDDPSAGAIRALRTSSKLLRRNCFNLFKLDLSFWWYFLAEVLLVVLCYGDTCLALLGITLPISATAGYFLFYVLYLAAQLVFYWFAKNQVEAAYAAAYDALRWEPAENADLPQKY